MSQVPNTSPSNADFDVENSTGANVRGDLNNILDAILTMNSGGSGPSYAKAYTLWADTSAGTMKIRNAANNDWIEIFQLDGTLTLEDGSASTPALAFRDDLNTGIFSSAADTFNVATAGIERMELGATTIFNEDGDDVDFRIEGDNQANLFYVDAGNDAIAIGTSTPLTPDGSNPDNPNNGRVFTIFGGSPAINLIHNTSGSGAASTDYSAINFGRIASSTNPYRGIIGYKQSSDEFRIATQNIIAFDVGTIGTDEKARFDSSGRFLIGTTTEGNSDADDFTIEQTNNGGLTNRNGTSSNGNIFFSDATSGDAEYAGYIQYKHSIDRLDLGTASLTRLSIDSSGRIMIGTTTEGNESADDFTIAGSSNHGITIRSGTSNNGSIFFSDATSGAAEYQGYIQYQHSGDDLFFGTSSLAGLQINSSGKVSVLRAGLNLENATATNSRAFSITNAGGTTGWTFGNGVIASAHQFVIYDNSAGASRLLINSSGLVGIGETNPSATLDVVGSSAVAAEFHATGSGGGYIGLFTGASGAAQAYIGRSGQLVSVGGTNDNFAIRSETEIEFAISTTQRAKITSNGIETTSTIKVETAANLVNPLTIDDSINNNFNTNAAVFRKGSTGEVGSISCTRSATTYNTTSDYRLKENAVTISDGITRLKTLKPYRFNFISDSSSTVDGFFAHEVTAVPEAVKGTKDEVATEDIEGKNIKKGDPIYQQIDHSKLVPLLVAAVQELITKVETLEAA